MERRAFIQTTFAGGLGAGAVGCQTATRKVSTAPQPPQSLGETALREELEGLDRRLVVPQPRRGLDRKARGQKTRYIRPHFEDLEPLDEQLLRSSMRSMMVAATVSGLPEADRDHPETKERIARASAEADFALNGTVASLENLSDDQIDDFQSTLREQPSLVDDIVKLLDEQAVDRGVPKHQRRRLSRIARHISARLHNEGADRFIRRTTQRFRRRVETLENNPKLVQDYLAADPDTLETWEDLNELAVQRYAGPQGTTTTATNAVRAAVGTPPPRPGNYSQEEWNRRIRKRRAGIILLGVGIGLSVLGAAFAPFTIFMSLIATTVGIVLLIVGIVLMARYRDAKPVRP